MTKHYLLVLCTFVLAGCQPKPSAIEPDELSGLELNAAKSDAERYFGIGSRIVAICGPSKGGILQLDKDNAHLGPDEIKSGVIALGFGADGKPDIVHRDALKEMIRVSEDAGIVSFLPHPTDKNLGTWKVEFPPAGIVEVHSLTRAPNGELVDVWASTRPDGVLPARGLMFLSKCKAI